LAREYPSAPYTPCQFPSVTESNATKLAHGGAAQVPPGGVLVSEKFALPDTPEVPAITV
jgi:hypothetical protein